LFLNQVPGFETLPTPVEGTLRVSSPQGVIGTAFRLFYNERGETLFTTTGPLNENAGTRNSWYSRTLRKVEAIRRSSS
jgi:hypothetical protein